MKTMENKYIVRSRISEAKFREILKYFTEDIEASKISNLTKRKFNGVLVKFGLVSNPNFKVKSCVVLRRFWWSIEKSQFKIKI